MKQLTLLALEPASSPPVVWERRAGSLGKLNTEHHHLPTGSRVLHCGHATANFPYYIVTASGERIVAPNGRGFMRLALAKEYVETVLMRDSVL